MAIADKVQSARDSRSGMSWAVITPAAADLTRIPGRLMVTADADVLLRGVDGTEVTFPMRAGVEYDLSPIQIVSASAGSVIAIYTVG